MTHPTRFGGLALALCAPVAAALLLARCGPPPTNVCKGRLAGDLVITEIMNDPTGTDTGNEYIEIYNASGVPIDLKGIAIFSADLTGGAEKVHLFSEGTIDAAGYFVVGDVRDANLPAYVNYSYGDSLGGIRNTGGTVGLRCAATELDTVIYTIDSTPPGPTGTAGHALVLDGAVTPPNAQSNDDMARWCDAKTEYATGSGVFGSPGQPNENCAGPPPSGDECNDGGALRAVVKPTAGQLVITEVMADPFKVSDANGEFIEVYATADVDLNGVEVYRENTASGPWALTPATANASDCMRLTAGSYAVIARVKDAATNGFLPAAKVIATAPLSLLQTGATLVLKSGAGTVELDRAAYGAVTAGASTQLNAATPDATANDTAGNWCTSATAWDTGNASDKGTPGTSDDCP